MSFRHVLIGFLAVTACMGVAQAAPLWTDGFETVDVNHSPDYSKWIWQDNLAQIAVNNVIPGIPEGTHCLRFIGATPTTDSVAIGTNLPAGTYTSLVVEAWVRVDSTVGSDLVVGFENGSGSGNVWAYFILTNDTSPYTSFRHRIVTGTGTATSSTSASRTLDVWHKWKFIADLSTKQLKDTMDGTIVYNTTPITPKNAAVTNLTHLYMYGHGVSIDGVKVYTTDEGTLPAACGDAGTVYEKGDLNFDCKVDFKDLNILVGQWLGCTDPANPTACNILL